MSIKRLLFSITFFSATLLLTACGSNEETATEKNDLSEHELASEQVMHLTVESELATTDSVLVAENITFAGVNQFIEGLYRLDENNEPVPALAESEDLSADGLTYTFHLREDAEWSNGDPVTAHDFVFSWRRSVDPTSGAAYAYLFENIKEMKNYTEIWMWMYNNERPHSALQYLTPRDFLLKYGKINNEKKQDFPTFQQNYNKK